MLRLRIIDVFTQDVSVCGQNTSWTQHMLRLRVIDVTTQGVSLSYMELKGSDSTLLACCSTYISRRAQGTATPRGGTT